MIEEGYVCVERLKDISWFVFGVFAAVDVKHVLLMLNAANLPISSHSWPEPSNCILQVYEQNKDELSIKTVI